jgi:hypothetical protein
MATRLGSPKVVGVVLTAVLYGASLLLPAFTFAFSIAEVWSGWDALAVVPRVWWRALHDGISEGDLWKKMVGVWNAWPPEVWGQVACAWLPNPLLLLSVVCLLKGWRRAALVTSALAVLGGLFVPLRYAVGGFDEDHRVCAGYWLWLASLGLPAVFSPTRAVPASGSGLFYSRSDSVVYGR